jgi:hypothetical protein
MENYEYANSGKPSSTFIHPVECKRSLNPVSELFIRTGGVTTGDLRLYDHGNFQIATGGNTGDGVLGELWCTFEIEFYKPKLSGAIGSQLLSDKWHINAAAPTTPFGTTQSLVPGSNLGTQILFGNTILFPFEIQDGKYLIYYSVNGGAIAGSALPPVPPTTNASCSFDPILSDGGGAWTQPYQALTDTMTSVYVMGIVIITGASAQVVFPNTGVYPLTNNGDLIITQINGNIAS